MFDGVAAGHDGVSLAFAAVDVTSGFFPKAMRLVDDGLQHRQRVGNLIDVLALGREGIAARREQLDPIRAMLNLVANR